MTGKVKAMLMDIEDNMVENFECWEVCETPHQVIESTHGKAVLDAYLDWLYMEIK
jgi:hypothetical protein